MAYIGNSPANIGNYQIVDDISSSFNASTTSFALASGGITITPAKSGQILANINGVMQQPDDTGTNGFKVSGSNIVFSSAPASGDTFWAVYQGQNVDIGTPSDDVVDTAHIKDNAVTTAKINADAVTGAKIADDAIDSEHYADGSIDNAHLADDAVGVAELSATGTASSSTFLRGDNSWASAADATKLPLAGGTLTGDLLLGDSDYVRLGAASGGDMAVGHDGSDGYIHNTTGNLIIRDTAGDIKLQAKSGEESIIANNDGSVELYHDNSKKLETSATGVTVTGTVAATAVTGDGSALTGISAGKILQVQYVNLTTEWTLSGTTEADLSGMSVTITPASTSSKILCMYTSGIANNNSGSYATMKLYRASTEIAHIVTERNAYYDYQMATITYVDSPSTTSATTYKITGQRNATGQHYPGINGTTSSLVLMEIE
jgi:hypothetical protein